MGVGETTQLIQNGVQNAAAPFKVHQVIYQFPFLYITVSCTKRSLSREVLQTYYQLLMGSSLHAAKYYSPVSNHGVSNPDTIPYQGRTIRLQKDGSGEVPTLLVNLVPSLSTFYGLIVLLNP